MSGHHKGEDSYFVPHLLLPLPHSTAWYCRKLLPNLQLGRQQANSCLGDKSVCCDKFLNHVLPYFIEVLVQDGVYFVKDFPNHPVLQLLKVSLKNSTVPTSYIITTSLF
jgi:hypothetical protein